MSQLSRRDIILARQGRSKGLDRKAGAALTAEQMAADIEAYLQAGGTITGVPRDATAYSYRKGGLSARPYNPARAGAGLYRRSPV